MRSCDIALVAIITSPIAEYVDEMWDICRTAPRVKATAKYNGKRIHKNIAAKQNSEYLGTSFQHSGILFLTTDQNDLQTQTTKLYSERRTYPLGNCAVYNPIEDRNIVAEFSLLTTVNIDHAVKVAIRAPIDKKMDTKSIIPVQNSMEP
jgi:hypothetical protein